VRQKIKTIAIDYFAINLGLMIAAIGIGLFLVPAQIAAGGVSGIATIIYHYAKFPVGMTMLILNIPLFLLGLKVFGRAYGAKTLFGTVMMSVYIDLFRAFIDPSKLIDFTKGGNMVLAPIFGGIILGIGLGIVMKFGGSTGGTDILAMTLQKYLKIPMGYAMMSIDVIVLITAATVFGLEKGLYAIIGLFTIGTMINKVFEGISYSKLVYIISDEYEEIREMILVDLTSGGTAINGEGLYTNEDKRLIMTVMRNKEIHELNTRVHEIDPKAFVIVSEVYEVLGEGFKELNKNNG